MRVDGVDVEPTTSDREAFGLHCRVYSVAGRYQGAPPTDWIAAALRGDEPGDPSEETVPLRPVTLTRVAPVLPVRSVAAALVRYRRMGFDGDAYLEPGVSTQEDPIYGFIRWGSVEIHLTRYRELDPKTNTSVCYLYVDDADALHTRWSADGVDGRLKPPADTPYGLREFGYGDPDGNLLRVGSPMQA